jgi:hypothetical protein
MTDAIPSESQYITIDSPPKKAEKFRQQMKKPYFRAQVNANIYLVNNLGNLLLAGEPQRVEETLQIPVYYSRVGAEKPIGFLSADPHTLKVYDEPRLLRQLRKVVNELYKENSSSTGR